VDNKGGKSRYGYAMGSHGRSLAVIGFIISACGQRYVTKIGGREGMEYRERERALRLGEVRCDEG